MQTTTLSYSNLHNHGELFANVFRARKQSFIIQKNWDLPQTDDMEFDQYDTPMSRWVAIHDLGRVYAGVRLTPSTARCGMYSYMIKDAQAGLLGGSIPADLLYADAPVDAGTWEASRLFVDHNTPQSQRRRVHKHLVQEMSASARALGATRLVALVAATWPRWLTPTGLDAQAIGREMWIDDGYFQCISINLAAKLH
ncbi:acyl-homoserine-lactone synthase [Paracoccus cavernae]|uniref:acyl-homoserine-lactone synthase n=1 Tax=Paracoccus cavernae TaxID=1571207 RepID=UPI0035F3F0AD